VSIVNVWHLLELVPTANNVLLLLLGIKYILQSDKARMEDISDNANSYMHTYGFTAMILLISSWVNVNNLTNTGLNAIVDNVCMFANLIVWIGLALIYVWFEDLDGLPRSVKSKHFVLYLLSLGWSITNAILHNGTGGISMGEYNFLVFGAGIVFMYFGGIVIANVLGFLNIRIGKIKSKNLPYFIAFGVLFPIWQLFGAYILRMIY